MWVASSGPDFVSGGFDAAGEYQTCRSATAWKSRGFSRAVRGNQRADGDTAVRRIPFSTAQAASCVRDPNPSFANALAT